jgi:hypothetical protein
MEHLKFTLKELLALEQIRLHYLQMTNEYKKLLDTSSNFYDTLYKAKELNIGFGICWFAYSMNFSEFKLNLNYETVLKNTLSAMGYNTGEYFYKCILDCNSKEEALEAIKFRRILIKKIVKFYEKGLYKSKVKQNSYGKR